MPADEFSPEVDLWGDPIPARVERRGRPVHVVTDEKRLRVAVLRSLDQTHEEIAAAMGITQPTLRKYYLRELKGGLAQKRAELIIKLWKQTEKGNVSAIKEFFRQIDRGELRAPVRTALRPSKPERLGKKAQADIDAANPDTATSMGELIARRSESIKLH